MDSLADFINTIHCSVHVALDEFQEIVILKESLQVEAAMRSRVQQKHASYFFIGSRRRILLGIFSERQRPFFQSAINYPLQTLPIDELVEFIAERFTRNRRKCNQDMARQLISLVGCHPYYSQKLAFFVYELSGTVTQGAIHQGMEKLILSEKPVFEAVIQPLSPHQRLLLQALAKEPTQKLLASDYIRNHRLGSVGGVQHSARLAEDLDLIEKDEETGFWRVVDPVFTIWLRKQTEEKV
jgi:hypothetical protein